MNKSNKKNQTTTKVLFALVIVLTLFLILQSTLAWFTSKSELKDTINFGNIQVDATTESLISTAVERDGGIVMPGDTVNVAYKIENKGEAAYYITKVSIIDSNQSSQFDEVAGVYIGNAEGDKLTGSEDKRVGSLAKDAAAVNMAHEIVIPGELDNIFQGSSAKITVTVYAIQQANLTTAQAFDKLVNLVNESESENVYYKVENGVAQSFNKDIFGEEINVETMSNAIVVTPANAQSVLDGDINGKTIVFSDGEYGTLQIRPTKTTSKVYAYDSSALNDMGSEITDLTTLANTGIYHYVRELENITFAGTKNAIFNGVFYVESNRMTTNNARPYWAGMSSDIVMRDYVRDINCTNNIGYVAHMPIDTMIFENMNFKTSTGRIYIASYGTQYPINNLQVLNCSFITDEIYLGNYEPDGDWKDYKLAAIYIHGEYTDETDSSKVENLVLKNNIITGHYQGILVYNGNNVTVTNNTIKNTTHNAIAIQSFDNDESSYFTGEVVISNNYISNTGDRAIRFGAGKNANILVENNTFVEATDTDNELLKSNALTNCYYIFRNNTYGGAKLEDLTGSATPWKIILS